MTTDIVTRFATQRITVPAAEEILGQYFPVLDHGFISLVDYMGGDESIIQAARVSYGGGTKKTSSDRGLIRYLTRMKHTTPLEMVKLKFHVAMPIFVARQWIRHRMSNTNEYSGRYSQMPMLFYTPTAEQMGVQSTNNKQGRGGSLSEDAYADFTSRSGHLRNYTKEHYTEALEEDVARELARIDLPLSTYTYWYWCIDAHNLMNFLRLRCDPHAQAEVRAYADLMAGMIKRVAPLLYEAWVDYIYCARTFSRMEMIALLERLNHLGGVPNTRDEVVPELLALGCSVREADENYSKLSRPPEEPNFSLDLDLVKPISYFEEMVNAATPAVDKK